MGQTGEMNTIILPGSQSSQILDLTTFIKHIGKNKLYLLKCRKIGRKDMILVLSTLEIKRWKEKFIK